MRNTKRARPVALLLGCLLLPGLAPRAATFDPPVGEAVAWLLEHNRDYQKALAEREKARMNVVEAASTALPNLSATATGTRLGKVQSFLWEVDSTETAELKVAAEDNYKLGLNLTQLLFSGSAFQAIGVSRSYERVSDAALIVERATLLKTYLTGYAQMGMLEDLTDLNQEVVAQTQARLDDARLLHEIGSLSRFDLLRSEVEHMNSIPALREAEHGYSQAAAGLALQLNLPPGQDLEAHDFDLRCDLLEAEFPGLLDGRRLESGIGPEDQRRLVEFALAHRAEVALSSNLVTGYRRAVKVYQAEHLPTLAAFANWERANQWDMFSQSESWNNSWNMGLQASLPLFNGFRTTSQVVKSRQDLRKARADDSVLQDAIRLECRTALDELQRRSLDMQAWSRNSEAAAEGLKIAETRREGGAGSELELRDARMAMKAARLNEAQARFELLKARIGLLHALGLLDQTSYQDLNYKSEE
ncbi:MAG: TolC family protein [Candidatus Delongbacteria bacterium]